MDIYEVLREILYVLCVKSRIKTLQHNVLAILFKCHKLSKRRVNCLVFKNISFFFNNFHGTESHLTQADARLLVQLPAFR